MSQKTLSDLNACRDLPRSRIFSNIRAVAAAAHDEAAPTANRLLQNCDGRDKSELHCQARCEYEQRHSIVRRGGGLHLERFTLVLAQRQFTAKSQ